MKPNWQPIPRAARLIGRSLNATYHAARRGALVSKLVETPRPRRPGTREREIWVDVSAALARRRKLAQLKRRIARLDEDLTALRSELRALLKPASKDPSSD